VPGLRRPATLIVALGLSAIAASQCSRPRTTPTPPAASAALQAALKAKTPAFAAAHGERGHHLWQEEQRFYKQNRYQLVWTSGRAPRARMDELIRGLRAAPADGLDSADYHVDELEALRRTTLRHDDPHQAIRRHDAATGSR
jgi:Scaffold domain